MRSTPLFCATRDAGIMVFVQPVFGTTPTQYAFGICFLVLGPALGLAGGFLQWQREENVAFGAIVVPGASWLGWIVSAVIAAVLFPGYPISGVPTEPVAVSFTLPGALTGFVTLGWLATRRPRTRSSPGAFALVAAELALSSAATGWALVALHVNLTTPHARLELPESAVVVFEEHWADNFIGDFTYRLDARMSEADFHAWMQRLGLQAHAHDRLRYEREGSSETGCGAGGWYAAEVGHFTAWCA